ncbi:hypothetical protein [Egbenema bharatensis]|uniref:hypothetical protein n=1 Tax=Egbenema bharatensis TaxID=3463334 RepID=UPI003A8A98CE
MSPKSSRVRQTRPAKPSLPDDYRQLLVTGDYHLNVKVSLDADYDDEDARRVAQHLNGSIQIKFTNPETEESDSIEIGYIWGWRTTSFEPEEIIYWADSVDQDVYNAFDWLIYQQKQLDLEEVLISPTLLLDRVFIEPEWRGNKFALPAVVTYLDLVAYKFVFLFPSPPDKSESSSQECKRRQKLLKQYWQKLGFDNYDRKHNVLWTDEWNCPTWLRG